MYDLLPNGDPDKIAFGHISMPARWAIASSRRIFSGRTRVVGRLPDLTVGRIRPILLVYLMAGSSKSVAASHYHAYFGITAQIWQKSTALSPDAYVREDPVTWKMSPDSAAVVALHLCCAFHQLSW